MPNIKSHKKSLRKVAKRAAGNRAVLSKMRTQFKKIIKMIGDSKLDSINSELSTFYKHADKAVKKGVIKKNNAARKKSEIAKRISVLQNKTVVS